ncbi:MAG: DNA-processing protein DprA [Thermoanaerobaculia bacterium]
MAADRRFARPEPRAVILALHACRRLSRSAICRLTRELPAWSTSAAPAGELARELALPEADLELARALLPAASRLAAAEERSAARHGARLVTAVDADFPAALQALSLPPAAIAIVGELPRRPAIAIVGPRRPSAYGLEVAAWFAGELAAAGVTVVSGFARGVDVEAHRAALAAPEGTTVAVLGCGLDWDYPRSQLELRRQVALQGAVLSEFACAEPPEPWRFPVRNRVIAALAAATLVVEAAPKSGSLITARLALELGRDVLAVPGRVLDELALGTNALLADGALVARHPDDVLELLGLAPSARARPGSRHAPSAAPPDSLPALLARRGPLAPEEIAAQRGMAIAQVLAELLELELVGAVRREPGPRFSLAREGAGAPARAEAGLPPPRPGW